MDKLKQKSINNKEYRRYLDTGYLVSSDGDIWSEFHNKSLTQKVQDNGYITVYLYKRGSGNYKMLVHRMVAICWIPNQDNLPEVNHKDLNKSHNYSDNLEWCTHSDNIKHMSISNNPINNIKDRNLGSIIACANMSKRVGQYLNNELIAEFESASSASKYIGCDKSGISKCCRGGYKQYKGYEWRYLDEETSK